MVYTNLPRSQRFLTLSEVAEELNTSLAQITALVKRGEIRGIQIGGRGQWRIERSALEEYIQQAYEDTERQLRKRRPSSPA